MKALPSAPNAGRDTAKPSASSPNRPFLAMEIPYERVRRLSASDGLKPGLRSSCVMPSLYDAVVTQPLPNATCAVTPRALVLAFTPATAVPRTPPCSDVCEAVTPIAAHLPMSQV